MIKTKRSLPRIESITKVANRNAVLRPKQKDMMLKNSNGSCLGDERKKKVALERDGKIVKITKTEPLDGRRHSTLFHPLIFQE